MSYEGEEDEPGGRTGDLFLFSGLIRVISLSLLSNTLPALTRTNVCVISKFVDILEWILKRNIFCSIIFTVGGYYYYYIPLQRGNIILYVSTCRLTSKECKYIVLDVYELPLHPARLLYMFGMFVLFCPHVCLKSRDLVSVDLVPSSNRCDRCLTPFSLFTLISSAHARLLHLFVLAWFMLAEDFLMLQRHLVFRKGVAPGPSVPPKGLN